MSILDAETRFREGLVAMVEARHADATRCFEQAMRIEKDHGCSRPQMQYLSYYGLSVALSMGPTHEALRACEVAARRDFFNADLLLNLGKVYMMAGRRTKALAAFERGLKLSPKHRGLRAALSKADRRHGKALRWLDRGHPVNYWLGRMRSNRKAPRAGTVSVQS